MEMRTRRDGVWSEWREVDNVEEWVRWGSTPGKTAELRVDVALIEADELDGY